MRDGERKGNQMVDDTYQQARQLLDEADTMTDNLLLELPWMFASGRRVAVPERAVRMEMVEDE